jgi:beta-N-acetylhexosaminidase
MMVQSIGPVIIDLLSTTLSQDEREMLQHPLVGGVILFTRNYTHPKQLMDLCRQIREAKNSPLLITVDHEGGRVQRFRDEFTRLPSMGELGQLYETKPELALKLAEACGWTMAAELLAVGIDLSFAPVVDLDKAICPAIGDRAFHSNPTIVIELAKTLMMGMKKAGMAATIKHFPGHGSVNLDSHVTMPVDMREFNEIEAVDMQPFSQLIHSGVQAVMPAHIVFPKIDQSPVGFSKIWLQTILRKQLKFSGVIFSDDLNMEGAGFAGDYASRAKAALEAGCDMVLICNNRQGAIQILDQLSQHTMMSGEKYNLLKGAFIHHNQMLRQSKTWIECGELLKQRVNL